MKFLPFLQTDKQLAAYKKDVLQQRRVAAKQATQQALQPWSKAPPESERVYPFCPQHNYWCEFTYDGGKHLSAESLIRIAVADRLKQLGRSFTAQLFAKVLHIEVKVAQREIGLFVKLGILQRARFREGRCNHYQFVIPTITYEERSPKAQQRCWYGGTKYLRLYVSILEQAFDCAPEERASSRTVLVYHMLLFMSSDQNKSAGQEKGYCFASIAELAQRCRCSETTLKESLRWLQDHAWIVVTPSAHHPKSKGQAVNVYQCLIQPRMVKWPARKA
jgi:hypothetical protein